jgi:hypothetical protein
MSIVAVKIQSSHV